MMVSNGNRDSKMDARLGRRASLWQGIHRGGARPHHLGHRLAASPVDQADDERR